VIVKTVLKNKKSIKKIYFLKGVKINFLLANSKWEFSSYRLFLLELSMKVHMFDT